MLATLPGLAIAREFPGSSMTGFLRSRFRHMLRKEGVLNRFFYLEFDPAILEE